MHTDTCTPTTANIGGTDVHILRKASGDISKEEAENIIAGIANLDEEDFDEPEYDDNGHVTGVAAASLDGKKASSGTPEELAAKKVGKPDDHSNVCVCT